MTVTNQFTNFVPQIWAAEILQNLRATLVFAQDGIVNSDYEGDVANYGNKVNITAFTDPAVSDYTVGSDMTFNHLTDSTQQLTIDQAKSFAITVDDVNARQALPNFVSSVSAGAAYNLANATDTYVSGLMTAGVATANKLTGVNVTTGTGDQNNAYAVIVNLRTILSRSNIPQAGRWLIVPPEFYALLLRDDRFIRVNESGTDQGLRNANVGRIAGFDVYESNTTPDTAADSSASAGSTTTGVFSVLAGHPMAVTFAQQIAKVESGRIEKQFGDYIKGLHLYGGKVVRPTALAEALVEVHVLAGQ